MRIPDEQLYERTPSQAEGERDDLDEFAAREVHAEVPRTTPSQAEGEYIPETETETEGKSEGGGRGGGRAG